MDDLMLYLALIFVFGAVLTSFAFVEALLERRRKCKKYS